MSILDRAVCRLYWEPGHGGCAIRNGRIVRLTAPPDLGRGPVYAMDWSPAIVATVTRTVRDAPDLLEPDEIAAADAELKRWVPSGPAPL